jgi:hypothetical protein
MENIADLSAIKIPIDIQLKKLEISFTPKVRNIRHSSGEQIVHGYDRVALGE